MRDARLMLLVMLLIVASYCKFACVHARPLTVKPFVPGSFDFRGFDVIVCGLFLSPSDGYVC